MDVGRAPDVKVPADFADDDELCHLCRKKEVFKYVPHPATGRTVGVCQPCAYGTVTLQPGEKTGRNEPCPCGSGRKFKKCCLNRESEQGRKAMKATRRN